MTRSASIVCGLVAALSVSSSARAQPEKPGPYAVGTWTPTAADAPPIPLTPGGVFYPTTGGPFPPVALIHGAAENGGLHTVMATALASRGLVVLAPTFQDGLVAPSTADGDAINALLDWSAKQSGMATSPIAGKVDGSTRGVIGHSNGGVIFYSAAHSPLIKSIVGLDANAYLDSATGFSGPSLHLLSEHHDCNTGKTIGYMDAPAPKLMATVVNGDHCDVDNPADPLCPLVCGGTSWNATASNIFERYAVAWTACILAHDTSVAPWIYGAEMQADVNAGLISGVQEDSAAMIACSGLAADAGPLDAGDDASADAGPPSAAATSASASTSASVGSSVASSGGTGGAPASASPSPGSTGGCGCKAATGANVASSAWWVASALGVWLARQQRRTAVKRARR